MKSLLLKRLPEELLWGFEYLKTTKGSGGHIIKRIGNVKSFLFPDYEKTSYSNGFRQKTINHWL